MEKDGVTPEEIVKVTGTASYRTKLILKKFKDKYADKLENFKAENSLYV